MHTLTFKNDKANTLSKMLEWANNHPRRIPYTKTTTDKQGLWLVKDHGIYLMSPTDENFVIGNEKLREKEREGFCEWNTVVYAYGYKPTNKNQDYLWDKTHAVSGDDFAEFVALTTDQVERVLRGGHITIKLSATQMGVAA